MQTLYLYHATSRQYLGQRTLQDDDSPYLAPGQGSTTTKGPQEEVLTAEYFWNGSDWTKMEISTKEK